MAANPVAKPMYRHHLFHLLIGLSLAALLFSACGPVPAAPSPLKRTSSEESIGALSETATPVLPAATATATPSPLPPSATPVQPSATPRPPGPTPLLPSPTLPPPSPTATLVPASATPVPRPSDTPVAATATVDPPAADPYPLPNGQGGLLVRNYIGKEVSFTMADKEYKIAASVGAGVPGELFIVLPPGRYTYSVSVPGAAANGDIVVEAGMIWVLPLRM